MDEPKRLIDLCLDPDCGCNGPFHDQAPQVVSARQYITDRQMLLHKDSSVPIDHAREQSWWDLKRECERLDLKFNEAKVEAVWEYRLTLVTEPDPERLKRREVLKAWSQQNRPRLLAPEYRLGEIWLSQNRDLLPGIAALGGIILAGPNALNALRGYRGTLVIVRPERRPREGRYNHWLDFDNAVREITVYERLSTWTEILP